MFGLAASEGMRVLIVEDEPYMAEAIRDGLRLEAAQRALLKAKRHETVAEIAQRFGFSHLGRFSAQYRRLYGQLPSQTLRDAHGS